MEKASGKYGIFESVIAHLELSDTTSVSIS
jgi:hypothetical protein